MRAHASFLVRARDARLLFGAAVAAAAIALASSGSASPPQSGPALAVRIAEPRGGQTSERVVTVKGHADGFRGDRLTIVLNGIPLSVASSNGDFSQPAVLGPGLNSIRAVVEQGGAIAQDAVAVYAQVPAKDLRVTMTWDTPGTDVDLWVTSPDGEKVMYSHREGKAGGILDTDVTTGFGPETYTQSRLVRGTFRIQAHAFRIDRPTRVEVTTVRFEGTPDEERKVLRGILLRTGDVIEVGDVVVR